jgi:hypothetical protein
MFKQEVAAAHAPDTQASSLQSADVLHDFAWPHLALHMPPQSTSLSVPFLTPSLQLGSAPESPDDELPPSTPLVPLELPELLVDEAPEELLADELPDAELPDDELPDVPAPESTLAPESVRASSAEYVRQLALEAANTARARHAARTLATGCTALTMHKGYHNCRDKPDCHSAN